MELPRISSIYKSTGSAGDPNFPQGCYPPLTPAHTQAGAQLYSSSPCPPAGAVDYQPLQDGYTPSSPLPPVMPRPALSVTPRPAPSVTPRPAPSVTPRPAPSNTPGREFLDYYASKPAGFWEGAVDPQLREGQKDTDKEGEIEKEKSSREVNGKGKGRGKGKVPASGNKGAQTKGSEEPIKDASRWTNDDRRLLLGFLSENPNNYTQLKTNAAGTAQRIPEVVFYGRRMANAIKSQWAKMKEHYSEAAKRLRSTGERQRDDEDKWRSIRLGWLDKMCPLFEEIEDILQRDKSVTPHYVSELGGEEPLAFKDGIPVDDGEEDDDDGDKNPDEDNEEDDENDEEQLHPPAGGAKIPRKRGESSGQGDGKKALKKLRKSAVQKVVESMEERQLKMEKQRMSYTVKRDNADRLL